MVTILDRVLEESVEAPRRWRRLSPDEILGEQEALLTEEEHKFVLDGPALVAVPLGPVVEHQAAARLENAQDFGGDLEEEAPVPVVVVMLAVAVFGLAIVWGRRDDQMDAIVGQLTQNVQTIAHVERPEVGPVIGLK